jgi:hypothetical protein
VALFGGLGLAFAIDLGIGLGYGSQEYVSENIGNWTSRASDTLFGGRTDRKATVAEPGRERAR